MNRRHHLIGAVALTAALVAAQFQVALAQDDAPQPFQPHASVIQVTPSPEPLLVQAPTADGSVVANIRYTSGDFDDACIGDVLLETQSRYSEANAFYSEKFLDAESNTWGIVIGDEANEWYMAYITTDQFQRLAYRLARINDAALSVWNTTCADMVNARIQLVPAIEDMIAAVEEMIAQPPSHDPAFIAWLDDVHGRLQEGLVNAQTGLALMYEVGHPDQIVQLPTALPVSVQVATATPSR